MSRRSVIWTVGATLYALINVGGAAYAIAMGELPHAALHVVLLVVGVGVWSRYRPARADQPSSPSGDEVTDRFRNLEQSIDAVAIEVERIGEGQRFMTNLLVDQEGPPASERSASGPADRERDRSS